MLLLNHTFLQLDEFEKYLKLIARKDNPMADKPAAKVSDLINRVEIAIEKDYANFLQSEEREKEDIVLQWERIKKEASNIISSIPDASTENGNLTKKKVQNLLNIITDFEKKIKNELYGNIDRVYSQKELEEMASKYRDFPKEILEDRSSDKYSERYL
ncbi:MAG TPA: hypothetical protein VIM16_10225 [Mucilaginibacter sp.]|jgi:ribosomal protein S17E